MSLKERDTIALHGINSDNWKELLSKPELSRYVKHGESKSIVAFAERSGLPPFLKAVHVENLVMVIGPSQLPLAHIEGMSLPGFTVHRGLSRTVPAVCFQASHRLNEVAERT
jgi:hypothetical protein